MLGSLRVLRDGGQDLQYGKGRNGKAKRGKG